MPTDLGEAIKADWRANIRVLLDRIRADMVEPSGVTKQWVDLLYEVKRYESN